MWTIRRAEPADSQAIRQQLHRAYRPIKKQGFNMEATDVSLRAVEESIWQDEIYVLVDGENRIQGTVRLQENDEPTVDTLGWFSVSPHLKGQGLGKMLMQVAEEQARKRGRRKLYLDTAKDHPWLPRFYEKFGYKKTGVIRWPGQNFEAVQFEKEL
ncbi:GNAT family N-acetyltransferase [Desmospora profundinema]|uniref:N-acetyltransferase YhbS n=1 Tax=Desmospora profundinema TaxID=1571184 RepID=A0ABU1IJ34_9BACL|nr:GNAT family N-acetyltransferase [Desmospora profundinema]MDR6224691.1 putative N-acetyltransferase YhbS [Desmospora profundinema]